MSSPRDPGNRGGIGDDLVSKMGSMSDADLDALLAGSAAKHSGGDDPFADIAKKMTETASSASAPAAPKSRAPGTPLGALTGDGALDISFSDYTPPTPDPGLFGKDEPEAAPIDPTTVVDHGVQSSVQDRPSSFDPTALSPDYSEYDYEDPSLDDLPEIDENGDPVIAADTRFAPKRPTVPTADDGAAPAEPGTGFHPGGTDTDGEVDYSQRWREEQGDYGDEFGYDEDEDEDESERKGPGLIEKIKTWYMGLPMYLRVALPLGLVVALIMGLTLLGGEDATAPQGAATGGGQIVNNDPAPPGAEDPATTGDLLTGHIETVSAKCADGSSSATNAFSTDPSVAWICHRAHGIDGAVLNIVFRQPVTLTEIRLTPGFDYVLQPSGDDEWNKHRVVTNILWRAGGKQFPQEIVPSRGQAVLTFDAPVVTESMSLTIQKSVDPNETAGESAPVDGEAFTEGFGDGATAATDVEVLDATAIQNIEIVGTVR